MADHTPPSCVAAAGNSVFLSSPCCESGVGLIGCTLAGEKTWGTGNLLAWTSPAELAYDGKNIYGGAGSSAQDFIWRVDPITKAITQIASPTASDERRRGLTGLEAHDGKVYIAIDAREDALANAVSESYVDLDACLPKYGVVQIRNQEDRKKANHRANFLSLLRITAPPSGDRNQGDLLALESTSFQGGRNHIMVAFRKPVALGSVVLPLPGSDRWLRLSYLKPDAPYPPNPFKGEQWIEFQKYKGKEVGWTVIPFPENVTTRAFLVTFAKGGDDVSDMLDEDAATPSMDDAGLALPSGPVSSGGKSWKDELEGLRLLQRRFENLRSNATLRVNSGTVNAVGEWDAQRTTPVSTVDPGIYAMEWAQPQKLRGLSIKEIDGQRTEIDVFTGPDSGPIDIKSNANWSQVATYTQSLRNYYIGNGSWNGLARYLDGTVDFGKDILTRAIRLRVVEQWTTKGSYPSGVRQDQGGQTLDPKRCRIYGVAPLHYLGGEPPVDPRTFQRIEVRDGMTGKLLQETFVPRCGKLAFGPTGDLFALSGTNIVKVDFVDSHHTTLVSDLIAPTALATDRKGQLYAFDAAPERNGVRVYDATGKFLRTIGTPGGFKAGLWDPQRLGQVRDMDIDDQNQLWIVEWQFFPKRITQWNVADGTFLREFLGNTAYGGGGVLDPYNKNRLFYGPMEFELNWETGATQLKALTWVGGYSSGNQFNPSPAGEVPIKIGDRTYLVTRPLFGRQQCGIVYLYENHTLRQVAAMGLGNGFAELNQPDIAAKLPGGKAISDFQFIWADRNGDGHPQADEVTFTPKQIQALAWFDRTLGVQAGATRYEVKEYLPNGVPVYEEKAYPNLPVTANLRMSNGNFYSFASGGNSAFSPAGERLWTYRNEGYGVHALYGCGPWRRDQVVSEFDVVGTETAHAGDLGEFLVTDDNVGCWNIWTADGLLAGNLFRDIRDPKAEAWSMKEHERGLPLENVTAGQEHFSGYFCKTADDRYYVVAGHNHVSVVEVKGLDQFKRLKGTVKVGAADVKAALAWDQARKQKEAYASAKLISCSLRGNTAITIDGSDSDWPASGTTMGDGSAGAEFKSMYDENTLYLCYTVTGRGPMKNNGNDWHTYYKSGACVDLQLATRPDANPSRTTPLEGDIRLLLTVVNGKPTAVLYRSVVPGTPESEKWTTHTMVFTVAFDQVEQLSDVRLACQSSPQGYCYEAAIPLKQLGLVIEPGMRTKFDWGVLVSGKDGNEVLQRLYWANKATAIVSDVAAEAALSPNLWGTLRFAAKMEEGWQPTQPDMGGGTEGKASDEQIMDLLEGK